MAFEDPQGLNTMGLATLPQRLCDVTNSNLNRDIRVEFFFRTDY